MSAPNTASDNTDNTTVEYLSLTSDSLASQAAHQARLLDIEARKRAATIIVPTLPNDVRDALRNYGEPIRLFGEDLADVRNRLRMIMARWEIYKEQQQQQQPMDMVDDMHLFPMMMGEEGGEAQSTEITETTYTHAPPELITARKFLCEYSLTQSRRRLERERQRRRGMIRWTRSKKRARLFNRDEDDDDAEASGGGGGGGLYTESTLKDDAKLVKSLDETCEQIYKQLRNHGLEGSQYGDVRPLSAVCTSSLAGGGADATLGFNLENNLHMPKLIATGGWSGGIKIWNGGSGGQGDDVHHVSQSLNSHDDANDSFMSERGGEASSAPLDLLGAKSIVHEDRIMGIAMRPYFTGITSSDVLTMVASASIDLTAKLCLVKQNEETTMAATSTSSNSSTIQVENIKDNNNNNQLRYNIVEYAHLKGHAARLCSVAFHPTGKYVATTSFDHTWRLWDVETSSMTNGGTELLLQDGHAREVYGVGFHPDGSLVSSTDFGGVIQCWDLRTGKSACNFVGHAKRVVCCEFAPNGFQLASAGDDGTIKVWDMRRPRRAATSIPAHTNLITKLKFAHSTSSQNGEFLVSSSFDGTGKIWSTRDWKLLNTLRGHEGKVMGIDILDGPRCGIVTCGFDKTLKLWQ
jgi:U4/U6 small nuclear ribonucleoprotein PRP4